MLYQVHWQFKSGRTEMIRQFELDLESSSLLYPKLERIMKEVNESHPLPVKDGWPIWMVCNEKSPSFVMTTADNGKNL